MNESGRTDATVAKLVLLMKRKGIHSKRWTVTYINVACHWKDGNKWERQTVVVNIVLVIRSDRN